MGDQAGGNFAKRRQETSIRCWIILQTTTRLISCEDQIHNGNLYLLENLTFQVLAVCSLALQSCLFQAR